MKRPRYTKPVFMPKSAAYIRTLFSPRLQRVVTLYSSLEYNHYVAVEQDPVIETFCEQPVRISIVIDGKTYTPIMDMWLRRKDGYEEYQEVKTSAKLNEPRSVLQIRAEKLWCQTQGTPFQVITEQNIGLDPQAIENWKQILPYLSNTAWVTHSGLDNVMKHHLRNMKSTTLGELEHLVSAPASEVYRAVFMLLHSGLAVANLSAAPLTARTLIEWKGGNGQT